MPKKSSSPKSAKGKIEYWHGGDAGLAVGDSLLPGNLIPAMKAMYSKTSKDFLGTYDPNFAYITTNRGLAFNYALRHAQAMERQGSVYKVYPSGKPLNDVDYADGVSFRCRTAVVIGVEIAEVNGGEVQNIEGLQVSTWHDGTQLYDIEGYPSPNNLQKKFGVTAADLRSLGLGAEMIDIARAVSAIIQAKNPGVTQDEINAADPTFDIGKANIEFKKKEFLRSNGR